MSKYTVITPSYNSFELMYNYFKSLEEQTYKDFEVIIVDDCSTDGSYEKTLDYANKSKLDIKVFRTEKNSGPGNARNIGLYKANSEWVTFIDNDDWVVDTFFERINKIVEGNNVNSVVFDYYTIDRENKKRVFHSMYKGDNGIVPLSECVIYVRNHTIGKFYKLSDCRKNKIFFPELKRCEDVAFVARALVACQKTYYLKEPLYYYFQRPTSLSNNKSLGETDMIKAFSILEKELGLDFPEEIKEKSITDLLYGTVLLMCKSNAKNREIIRFIESYETKYPTWYKCKIVKHISMLKRIFLFLIRKKKCFYLKILAIIHTFLTVA